MNNQTKNPLLAFGTPARVVINGEQITHPQAIDAYILKRLQEYNEKFGTTHVAAFKIEHDPKSN